MELEAREEIAFGVPTQWKVQSARPAPRRAYQGAMVRLLEADPDLACGLTGRTATLAREHVTATVRSLPRGPVRDLPEMLDGDVVALFVLEGLLLCQTNVGGRASVDLVGAGDVVRPRLRDGGYESLPSLELCEALEPATIAILDSRVAATAARFPGVIAQLFERMERRAHLLSVRLAISQVPRVEDRLLAVLWCLADRWGRVEPSATVLPLRLPQRVLAELVSAQRPTVSQSFKQLAARGLVERRNPGWALSGAPPALLRPHGHLSQV